MNSLHFDQECRQKMIMSACVALLLTFTVSLFAPLEMYFANASDFWFSMGKLLPVVLVCFIVSFTLLFCLLFALKGILQKIALAAVFGVGLAFYVQGNFMQINYGVLNGEEIDWGTYRLWGAVNLIIWAALILIPFIILKFKKQIFNKVILSFSCFIIAIQVVTLGTLFINTPDLKGNTSHSLTTAGMLQLSKESNIVVFLLDCFDAELFNELLEESPEYKEAMQDFTFYENTVGGATRTKLAVPYILTGQAYTTPVSYTDYVKQGYQKTPVFKELERNHYDTRIYTNSMFADSSQKDLIQNLSLEQSEITSYANLGKYYYRFTAFRYAPHFFKKFFWMYSGDFDQIKLQSDSSKSAYQTDDAKFYTSLKEEQLEFKDGYNAFRFYHLMGPHPPYTLNAMAERLPEGKTSEMEQAKGNFLIIQTYLEQMKSAGVYDSSMIIIMSDHGSRGLEQNPLFLMKDFHDSNPFTVSELPVSYADLQGLLVAAANAKGNPIDAFQDLNEVVQRKRYFYIEQSKNNEVNIIEYASEGHASDAVSFYLTGNVYHGNTLQNAKEIPAYVLGTELSFKEEATANKYCVSGFSKNEGEGTWTDDSRAEMHFELNVRDQDLRVETSLNNIFGSYQRVSIIVNDQYLSELVVRENNFQFVIPKEYLTDTTLQLIFELPDALNAGLPQDNRQLALFFTGLKISSTQKASNNGASCEISHETVVDFSQNGNSKNYLLGGWHGQEKECQWTSSWAEMVFFTKPVHGLEMELRYAGYTDAGITKILLNGSEIGVLDSTDDSPKKFTLPSSFLNKNGEQILTFETPNAVSPKANGKSEDTRELGICIFQISFTYPEEI